GRASFGRYLIAAKCPKASSFFYDQLLSRDPTTKANACYYLGEYGNKKHIRRMKIISTTDAAYKIRGLTRIYWVRDSCKQAIGRIRLRQ
ncbi:hypothetical protein KKF84_16100, partial [Myxococcota bacterium]|nr:hypothetical protein [Myxococcota bacterium]